MNEQAYMRKAKLDWVGSLSRLVHQKSSDAGTRMNSSCDLHFRKEGSQLPRQQLVCYCAMPLRLVAVLRQRRMPYRIAAGE